MGATELVVGRIGKAHGLKGEVSVEIRTDEPERRFALDAVLIASVSHRPEGTVPPRLTVAATRWHQSRLLVRFAEIPDRNGSEAARGALLSVEVPAEESPDDPEEFYDHQLIGLRVETVAGTPVGTLTEVVHGAQDLLVIDADGAEVLVPFVAALVPDVDVAGGRIVVEDRPGLLSPIEDS